MKNLLFSFICCLIGASGFAQNTIIETGRPKPFYIRNAQEIAGKKFNVKYEYLAFRGETQLDSINQNNQLTFAKLEKKHGVNWKQKLDQAIEFEMQNIQLFNSLLKKGNLITDENTLYYTKTNCGNKYKVEIYPAIEPENRTKDQLIKTVRFQQKEGKTIMK